MLRTDLKIFLIVSFITIVWGSTHGYSQTVTYTYDAFDRIEKAQYAGGAAVEFKYDKAGNRKDKSAAFGLKDVIAILELMTGSGDGGAYSGADINGDGKIGLEELIYVMQRIAGLR